MRDRVACGVLLLAAACSRPEAGVQDPATPATLGTLEIGAVPAANPQPEPASASPEPSPPANPPDTDESPLPMLGATMDQNGILAGLRTSAPVRFRSVGTTSTVFETLLEGPLDAAFKVPTQRDPKGYLNEVAAYRIARFLRLDNVPPATVRRISSEVLHARHAGTPRGGWAALEHAIIDQSGGEIVGAAIYWLGPMRNLYLERPSRMQRWTAHLLQSGYVPALERETYRDISTMLAFDYLIGNWDRFSGGNTQGPRRRERLFVRDHNSAFTSLRSMDRHDRLVRHLRRTERFSGSFIRRLIMLDEQALRTALAEETERAGRPLLSDEQIGEVMDRRDALLSYFASLFEVYGRDRVLMFE